MTSQKAYNEQVKEIASRDFEKGQIVLLGDCIMDDIDMNRFFPDVVIYNNAVEGDTTTRLQETLYKRAIKYKPSKLFLSIGSNDLAYESFSVKEVYHHVIDIVETIQKRSKETEIYLVTTLPVHPSLNWDHPSDMSERVDNMDVSMLNYYLKNYARRHHIKVVDAFKHLKNDFDQLCIQYTTDGFRLNDAGYERYTALIKQHV